ncbi:MAG: FUSC family protein [Terracidiphilus sp.]|nr:FUSC family protein [Terracidiphilus sp.]MDR3797433.1 FUSC family protein [Terracidiphilus sp.]
MRLRTKKTWSQHQLAVKLRLESDGKQGILTFERRRLLIHAAKTALAATLCWWLALRFGLHDGYWGSISAIIVMQSNVGATVTASRDRILGTFIGAFFGFAFSLFSVPPWNYVLAVLLAIVVSGLLGMRDSARLACVTITIIMLVPSSASRWNLALDRVLEVLFGIVIALAVTTLVLPDRARVWLRDGLAQEFLVLGAFFEAILTGFRGAPSQDLPALRENLQALLRSNNQLLEAARNEPSSPGWREGLSLLTLSGRSLYNALLALELAVKDSHEDRFAQQLEPILTRLADDIHSGFNYIAGCIHRWRFDKPAEGVHLEQDIADLEARMDAVRHTGIDFSQAEIMRAYAVQLHLKQIARLLRAARIETSHAVGQGSKESESV